MGDTTIFYYREPIEFSLVLLDADGRPLGWPGFDWRAELWTPGSPEPFLVTCAGGEGVNCHNDGDGRIHIIAENHGLSMGRINLRFSAEVPDAHYPTGKRPVVASAALDMIVGDSAGNDTSAAVAVLRLPYNSAGTSPTAPVQPSSAPRAFLSVGPGGELVAHGVEAYLEQGLTPVVFRHLRRSNKLTEEGSRGPVERRWTRFTTLRDAVAVDADTGAVSFRTDLLSPSPDITEDCDAAPRTNDASALITSPEGSIVYGRRFFSLNGPADWRMLVFDFILGFVDLTSETPGRRWTLADTPVRLPFQVRFTPIYEREGGATMAARAHFGFELRT
ncbi:MAG: hypothetical protein K2I40_03875 [Bifidobacterium castoris]|nr:hypothetical protein [Bifidobacterium castoris]